MKIRNIWLAIISQMPLKRLFRNFFITRNAWGLFSKNSHINQKTNEPKITYSSLEKANKAARKMREKYGGEFSAYKCAFCDGYHIGKNKVVTK